MVLSIDCVSAQEPARKQENPEPPAAKAEIEPVPPAAEPGPAISATSSKEGKSSTESAAAQRNENVYILRIDNNAVKESLQRLGASVTIVDEPRVTADYYATELGQPAAEFPFLKQVQQTGWHGELYESHQNSVLNARTFFQVGAVKPSHQNHYGFLIGGPVDTRNAFTFEGGQRKIRGNVNGNVLVPAAGEREPLTPDVEKQAVIRHFLSAYPNELPNRPDFDPRALNTNSPQSIDEDRLGGRWDLSLSARRRLMSRYFHQTQYIRSFQLVAGQNPDTTLRAREAQTTLIQTAGDAVWTTGFAFRRLRSILVPEQHAVGPSVRMSDAIEYLGPKWNVPLDRRDNSFRAGTQVAWIQGRHRLTAGAEGVRFQLNGTEVSGHRGSYTFSDDFGRTAVENLLWGTPTYYFTGIGDTNRGFRSLTFQSYAGDEWSAGANLHLTFGLRYGLDGAPSEVNHRTEVPYRCDWMNLSPRFGFAYSTHRWGIWRGAYTVSYGQIAPATYAQARDNPPGVISIEVDNPNLLDPLAGIDLTHLDANTKSGLLLLSPDLRDPYVHQYNLSWERQFAKSWSVRVGYVGSRARQLFAAPQTNRGLLIPGVESTTGNLQERRADPGHYQITRLVNMGDAFLDAGLVTVTLPSRKGFSARATYTLSHAIDTGSDYTSTGSGDEAWQENAQWEFELKRDLRGSSRFDSRHALLAQYSWDLPSGYARGVLRRLAGGWNISGATLLKTGTPFTVRVGSDSPGFGNVDSITSDRPNLIDAAILGRNISNPDTAGELLPRSAFGYIAADQVRGNLGRNTFRKDGIINFNLALARQWLLPARGGERRLLFRAEAFNALNHAQFDAPGFLLVNNNFGKITNTLNDGRILQLSLLLNF